MAQVLTESGRYATQEAVRRRRKFVIAVLLVIATLGIMQGLAVGLSVTLQSVSTWISVLSGFALVLGIWGIVRWAFPKMDALEIDFTRARRKSVSEAAVAMELASFPDTYRIINDVRTPAGRFDHVVVGPSGVFVLKTQDWRGIVAGDGTGELICNGQPLDQPHVWHFIGQLMDLRQQVKTLIPDLYPYFQGVFVFTAARLEAGLGTTRTIHCVRDEQLRRYIVERRRVVELEPEEIETIAKAFLALEKMEPSEASTSTTFSDSGAAQDPFEDSGSSWTSPASGLSGV